MQRFRSLIIIILILSLLGCGPKAPSKNILTYRVTGAITQEARDFQTKMNRMAKEMARKEINGGELWGNVFLMNASGGLEQRANVLLPFEVTYDDFKPSQFLLRATIAEVPRYGKYVNDGYGIGVIRMSPLPATITLEVMINGQLIQSAKAEDLGSTAEVSGHIE